MKASELLLSVHAHRLLREAEERVQPVIQQGLEPLRAAFSQGKFRVDEPSPLNSVDNYFVAVFTTAMALTNALERASLAIEFVQRLPSPKYYERRGITLFVWLEYHYAAFVTSMATVLDTALILTNAVLRLGLEEKKCRWHVVVKHEKVKGTPIAVSLQEYDRATKKLQELRQHHVHRAAEMNLGDVLCDESVHGFRLFDSIKRWKVLGKEISNVSALDDPLLSVLYNATPRKLARQMSSDIQTVVPIVLKIFDALAPEFIAFARLHQAAVALTQAGDFRKP